MKSYVPKATESEFCNGLDLCSVRKSADGTVKVGIKELSGTMREEFLGAIINADQYNGKEIVRVYASGHIFLNDDKSEVFLVTTEKKGRTQHQFTGGSPLEEENQKVFYKDNGVYKFALDKVRLNARIRTKNRTGVEVIEEYNKKPLVDRALMENEENGVIYYKLVCLMHFIVKKYQGTLSCTQEENVIGAQWYKIDQLPSLPNIAPNAYIVTQSALLYDDE